MNKEMKFGIAVLQSFPWSELEKIWQTLDSLNFDSMWVADHFVNYTNPAQSWFEGWTTLGGMAGCTSRIRIGTLVTSIPFRNPAVLARQAMTIDHISNGRLNIGIGAGAPGNIDPSYKMAGIENWSSKERTERLKEQAEIIDLLLCNTSASYKGKYYQLEDAMMAPGPVQKPRPPITIAAHTKASLRVAAEHADTWNSFGTEFGAPPEVVVEVTRKRSELIDKYCEELGRDPGTLTRSLLVFGAEGNTAFASGEHFTEVVERYSEIGINELIFFYPFFAPNQIPNLGQIARDVIPTLRKS
jgi:alkanesulfonate monooxygenase SsuD/methylene tetrahydromethanopterin reductase-like flavin-dependent oxidoreductase (luciferase family)